MLSFDLLLVRKQFLIRQNLPNVTCVHVNSNKNFEFVLTPTHASLHSSHPLDFFLETSRSLSGRHWGYFKGIIRHTESHSGNEDRWRFNLALIAEGPSALIGPAC